MLKSMPARTGITVGQLAETAGVGVETIRHDQRIRLLALPKRNYGRIRRYSADDLLVMQCARGSRGCGCPNIDALVRDEMG